MAADQGGPRRRTSDPLLSAISEGVASGYQALGRVAEGMNESIRRTAAPRTARAGAKRRADRARRATGHPAPHTIVGDIADFTADVFDRFGEAFRDVAERDRVEPGAEVPRLELQGCPGETTDEEFRFSNTGSVALIGVTLRATDLLGPGRDIDAGAVRFEHGREGKPQIARMRPGAHTSVTVAVDIPADVPAGTYHGVMAAASPAPAGRDPAEGGAIGAWALLELEVVPADRRAS